MGAIDIYINKKYIQTISSYLNISNPRYDWLPKGQGISQMTHIDVEHILQENEPCDLTLKLKAGESKWEYHTKFQVLAIAHY